MNVYHERLKQYLQAGGAVAEHFVFDRSCHTVEEAAQAVNASAGDFVKNICMIGQNGEFVVAIVKGEDRASTSRAGTALHTERPRLAAETEILERTGFPPGGVPSFGFEATFLIDPAVTELNEIYTGGGSPNSLVKIKVGEMLRLNNGCVIRVRK